MADEPILITDHRDGRLYSDRRISTRYEVLEAQRLSLGGTPRRDADEVVMEQCARHARHEGMVRLAAQRGYALGGTSILEAKARGDIPKTPGYTGPVVA